jgi:hypothetical protein
MPLLYHVSSHPTLVGIQVGDTFILEPGPQHAEGPGVYFSEAFPRLTAAEGANRRGRTGVVQIRADSAQGWWRTKNAAVRRFKRPRTWHTDGKSLRLEVIGCDGDLISALWEWL